VTTVQTVQRLHLGPFHRYRSGIFIVISGTTCHSVPHLGAGHRTEPHLSEVRTILAKGMPRMAPPRGRALPDVFRPTQHAAMKIRTAGVVAIGSLAALLVAGCGDGAGHRRPMTG
jgi:hypothetical protein